MADRIVKIVLSDQESVWARVRVDGPQDVGIDKVLPLRGFGDVLRSVASEVRSAAAGLVPEVSVEFGLELATADGGVVAALVGVGGKASITVTMTWASDRGNLQRDG